MEKKNRIITVIRPEGTYDVDCYTHFDEDEKLFVLTFELANLYISICLHMKFHSEKALNIAFDSINAETPIVNLLVNYYLNN